MYQSVFVGGLLPFLGHGSGLLAGEGVDGVEEGDGDSSELENLGQDAQTLALGGGSAGTVGTEGNIVSYIEGREYMSAGCSILKNHPMVIHRSANLADIASEVAG
jgi:hypothetical protein